MTKIPCRLSPDALCKKGNGIVFPRVKELLDWYSPDFDSATADTSTARDKNSRKRCSYKKVIKDFPEGYMIMYISQNFEVDEDGKENEFLIVMMSRVIDITTIETLYLPMSLLLLS